MANFLRSVLIPNRPETADRTFQQDLPVNPLSMILVTIRGIMTSADTTNPIAEMLSLVSSLAVRYRGQDIIRGSLIELAVINAAITGTPPWGYMPQDGAGESWHITVPISLGRIPYNINECFPAVRRGDLVLEMTVDTVLNNADLIDLQVETIELLDETPKMYLKYTAGQQTFTSTTTESIRLPIGNPLLGVLLFGTTIPSGALQTATWEQLRIKIDNVEALYAATNWDTLHFDLFRKIKGDARFLLDHGHRFNGAAAAFATTLEAIRIGTNNALERFAYFDFDPLGDSSYQLETAGRADVVIQRDVGTADLGRFIPIELVSIGGQAGA